MKDHNTRIGSLDWGACSDCVHCDKVKGGCSAPDDEYNAGISVEFDSVYCGAFKEKKAERGGK